MAINIDDASERLVAEQAVLAFRAVKEAMRTAPHGRGLAVMEDALMDKGLEALRVMMQEAVSAHPEAQKGGPAPCRVPAGTARRSRGPAART
jgi:hypothetical protein